jgi:hypothetical protein
MKVGMAVGVYQLSCPSHEDHLRLLHGVLERELPFGPRSRFLPKSVNGIRIFTPQHGAIFCRVDSASDRVFSLYYVMAASNSIVSG